MAQLITYEVAPGIRVDNCYLKVAEPNLNYHHHTGTITVLIYRDKVAAEGGVAPALGILRVPVYQPQFDERFSHAVLSEAGMNPTKAAYEYLASFDEPLGLRSLFEGGVSDE